jgi:nitrogen fixation-related uncharacterized protein
MTGRLRNKSIAAVAGLLLALAPMSAFAHDNVGDDELAAANWMLIGAIITIVLGLIWGVWALRAGQFSNIEESKYRMLELAEDFDAIMAEADARESRARSRLRSEASCASGIGPKAGRRGPCRRQGNLDIHRTEEDKPGVVPQR